MGSRKTAQLGLCHMLEAVSLGRRSRAGASKWCVCNTMCSMNLQLEKLPQGTVPASVSNSSPGNDPNPGSQGWTHTWLAASGTAHQKNSSEPCLCPPLLDPALSTGSQTRGQEPVSAATFWLPTATAQTCSGQNYNPRPWQLQQCSVTNSVVSCPLPTLETQDIPHIITAFAWAEGLPPAFAQQETCIQYSACCSIHTPRCNLWCLFNPSHLSLARCPPRATLPEAGMGGKAARGCALHHEPRRNQIPTPGTLDLLDVRPVSCTCCYVITYPPFHANPTKTSTAVFIRIPSLLKCGPSILGGEQRES